MGKGWEEEGLHSCLTALSLWECVSLKDSIQDVHVTVGLCVWGYFILFMQKASTYTPLAPHTLEVSL